MPLRMEHSVSRPEDANKRDTIRDPNARPHTLRGLNHGAPGAEEEPPSEEGSPVVVPSLRGTQTPLIVQAARVDAPGDIVQPEQRPASGVKKDSVPRLLATSITVPPTWTGVGVDDTEVDAAAGATSADASKLSVGNARVATDASAKADATLDATQANAAAPQASVVVGPGVEARTVQKRSKPSEEPTVITPRRSSDGGGKIAMVVALLALCAVVAWLVVRAKGGAESVPHAATTTTVTSTPLATQPAKPELTAHPAPANTATSSTPTKPAPGASAQAPPVASSKPSVSPKPVAPKPAAAPGASVTPTPKASDPFGARPF